MPVNRRESLSSSAAALAVASHGSLAAQQPGVPPAGKRRHALVGTGSRGSSMWGKGVKDKWADTVELVARNRRKLIVGHTMRFAPAHVRIQEFTF